MTPKNYKQEIEYYTPKNECEYKQEIEEIVQDILQSYDFGFADKTEFKELTNEQGEPILIDDENGGKERVFETTIKLRFSESRLKWWQDKAKFLHDKPMTLMLYQALWHGEDYIKVFCINATKYEYMKDFTLF